MKHFIYTTAIRLSLLSGLLLFWTHVTSQNTLPGHWEALGDGLNGSVLDIHISGNDVYVAGNFTNAGGVEQADYIARWDGEQWNAVGSKIHGPVHAIIGDQDGIIIGGEFTNIGGISAADFVAKWDGQNWQPIGPVINDAVTAISLFQGNLYIAGDFTDAGGHANADQLAYFDGNNWQPVGEAYDPSTITWISALDSDDGYLYAGGNFVEMGSTDSTRNIARWDGVEWHSMHRGFGGDMGVTDIAVHENDVYVSGDGGPLTLFFCGVARWDGNAWKGLDSGVSDCLYGDGAFSLEAFDNGCIVGGTFGHAGGVDGTTCLANYDGDEWSAFGEPLLNEETNNVMAISRNDNDVYVGGSFTTIAGVVGTQNIAHWVSETVSDVTVKSENDIKIFPNPSSDVIYFRNSDRDLPFEIVLITDITGRPVYAEKYPQSTIDISFLPKGIYSLEMRTKSSRINQLFIKS